MPNNQDISQVTSFQPAKVKKKKKRDRVRNRKRNKCNRVSAGIISEENLNIDVSLTLQDTKEEEREVHLINSKNFTVNRHSLTEKIEHEKIDLLSKSLVKSMQSTINTKDVAHVNTGGKTREEIMVEREAKKLAKQAKKMKLGNVDDSKEIRQEVHAPVFTATVTPIQKNVHAIDKTREEIKAERELKKQAKHASKAGKSNDQTNLQNVTEKMAKVNVGVNIVLEEKKKPALTKAERRAIQEAQRAAKTQALTEKPNTPAKVVVLKNATETPKPHSSPKTVNRSLTTSTVKLFNHLESKRNDVSLFVNNAQIHPCVTRLGEQYVKRTVVGSNARCIAFLNALKMVIQDFETPPKKEFARSLEAVVKVSVEHLQKCRPLAVSVSNAYKHIKHVLTQLPTEKPESELKEHLCHFIDTYIENQIGKAAQAISCSMQEKIKNGDVILTFGCSSLINYICEEAHQRHVDFRVIVVDSRPFCEGQELLRRLATKEIPCTYVLINAVGFVMPEVTKVLLGAHALLSNGYVMARTGTAQVALVANSFNVPVLVCCETHKFSERFQTDAIVYNELGDPHDLVLNEKCSLTNWQMKNKISPLNLIYDITPPELVTAVVTEVSILPCTSVPVILRIKPTEIGYYS